jgi:putative ABC transport system permease protein
MWFRLLVGPLLANRTRVLLSVLAIALGVALGYAIALINRAAIDEFGQAVRVLSGESDLTVRGAQRGFSESVYPLLARQPDVEVASPMLEIGARLAGLGDDLDRRSLDILGLDVFRAARIQPQLIGESEAPLDILRGDALFLSASAMRWLDLQTGDRIAFQVGTDRVALRVAGLLPAAEVGQRIGVMDIAAAQKHFGRIGSLNRIEVRLSPGVPVATAAQRIQSLLPAGVYVEPPQLVSQTAVAMTRAYRVNLNVLALVALFTGGLLVFSTQALSIVQRRSQLALLRVLGMTRRGLVAVLVGEAAVLGCAGSLLGLLLGYLGARLIVSLVGADLGAGIFTDLQASLSFEPAAALLFMLLGILAAVCGSVAPALEAARAAPAQALKAGDEMRMFQRLTPLFPGVLLLAAGAASASGPPVAGLPLFGYVSIAMLLLGTIALMPRTTVAVLSRLPLPRRVEYALGLAQLRAAPGQAMVSLASVVAAVSLATSVAIMVISFRTSLEDWLAHILPGDMFVRTSGHGETAYLSPPMQELVSRIPGVRSVEFLAGQRIRLESSRPPVTLLARDIDPRDPGRVLSLVSDVVIPQAGQVPAWISEIAADNYGYALGEFVELPIGGQRVPVMIAGIWRDYARMNGAVMIGLEDYRELTGNHDVADAQLWLEEGADVDVVRRALLAALPSDVVEISLPNELRTESLTVFDRTFAVTYALEGVAIVIGLAGLSASFSALTLARRREFGMLRHIGFLRAQIVRMLAFEGALVSALGLTVGLLLGWVMSVVLIDVVNRQSFHWSMDVHLPWSGLGVFAPVMLVAAMLAAVSSARRAVAGEAVRAVREDW